MTKYPFADLGPFQSEINRLRWLVETLQTRATAGLHPQSSDSDEDLNHVATSLVSYALHLARGAIALLESELTIATAPVERALYELWCEVRELLDQGSFGARKMMMNSLLELAEAASETDNDRRWKQLFLDVAGVIEREFPDVAAAVRQQRRKRQFHWSGRTRTDIMRIGSPDAQVFRLLSWEAHAVHVALRNALIITSRDDSTSGTYPSARAWYMRSEQIAFRCAVYLSDMWDRYFDMLGIDPITWPESL